jgi:HEAT repeat protein
VKLRRALGLLDADVAPLVLLGLVHLLLAAAHSLSDIGATSLVVSHLGADVLPELYIAASLLLAGLGLLVIPHIDRLHRVRVFRGTILVLAIVLGLVHHQGVRAPGLFYRGLYLLTYLMQSLLFLQFWLVAGEVCDLRQAKRLFPLLLGFSLAGGLLASAAASFLPRLLPTEDLLLIGALLLVLALLPLRVVGRRYGEQFREPVSSAPLRVGDSLTRLPADLGVALSTPLLRTLAPCLLLFALLAQVLDFQVGKAASLRFLDPSLGRVDAGSLTTFYATLNGAVIGAGAFLQFFVANRLFSTVGVTRGLLLAPLGILAGFAAMAVVSLFISPVGSAFFFTVLATRALQKTLRISLYRSSVDLLYNPVPTERRGRAKAVKETVIEPAGACLAGLLLLGGARLDPRILTLLAVVLSGAFLYLTLKLKAQYLDALVRVLREKSRFRFALPSAVQPRQVEKREVVSDLERALADDQVAVRLLAVELAAELREPATAPVLARRFRGEPDSRVRATMVMALGRLLKRRWGSLSVLEPSLGDTDARVRANGIEALAQIGLTESSILVNPFARDPEPRIRANAAVAFSRLDPEEGAESGLAILTEMYDSRQEAARLSALYGLGELGNESAIDLLAATLGEERFALRRRAILGLAQAGKRQGVRRLVGALEDGDGATRHLAARALATCGEAVVDDLILSLWSSDVEGRRYVTAALGRIGSARARAGLVQVLSLEAEQAYYDLLRIQKLASLPQNEGVRLLVDSLWQRVHQARRNALDVLRAVYGERRGMRIILSNLTHPEPYVRSSAVEALEGSVDSALLTGVLPLFEHSDPEAAVEQGRRLYQFPERGPLEVVFELTSDPSRWVRACALYALGEIGGQGVAAALERKVNDPYELARLNAIEALGRRGEAGSLGILEAVRTRAEGRVKLYADAAVASIQGRITPA